MHGSFWCSVSKSFFDTLLQVFLHWKSRKTYDFKRKTPFLGFFRNFFPSRRATFPG